VPDSLDLVLDGAGPQRGGERAHTWGETGQKEKKQSAVKHPHPAAAMRRTARAQSNLARTAALSGIETARGSPCE
jgi:hypothetical protein